jgi:1,4-alpha-glucan branching enzyme
MWAHPAKQLMFMGSEFAQDNEWSEERSLDWWLLDYVEHSSVQLLGHDLNATYRGNPALWQHDADPAGFRWIDANDASNNTFSFLRQAGDGQILACIANFAGVPHEGYRVGLPCSGQWHEVLNTDAEIYNGSGVGNLGAVEATDEPWHGLPASAVIRVPPLATLWLRSA